MDLAAPHLEIDIVQSFDAWKFLRHIAYFENVFITHLSTLLCTSIRHPGGWRKDLPPGMY
jgi:hypothetical protein